MSFFPGKDPVPGDTRTSDAVEQMIVPRSVDLGGFQVHRALPSGQSRMVGPFIFFDHFGPAVFKAGRRRRRAAASAYRPRHRHLPVRRRDRASRQPRHPHADPARRGQLDDRGPRYRAFRAHRRRTIAPAASRCMACSYGSRCRMRTRKRRRPSPIPRQRPFPQIRDAGMTLRVVAGTMQACARRSRRLGTPYSRMSASRPAPRCRSTPSMKSAPST